MADSIVCLSIIFSLAFILCFIGIRRGGVIGVILIGQSAYWTISYVLRPAVLLFVQPRPVRDDSVADGRIAAGGYEIVLPYILQIIVLGLAVYVVAILILFEVIRRPPVIATGHVLAGGSLPLVSKMSTFAIAYAIGWLCRLGVKVLGNSPTLDTLSGLAIVGAAGIIVFGRNRKGTLMVVVAVTGELAWSVLSASKTPVIAAGLCLAVRLALLGWNRSRQRLSLLAGGAAVIAFPALQQIKLSDQTAIALDSADANYPWFLQPIMSIIRRFDLFSAVTDAALFGPGGWMSLPEFASRLVTGLVPQPLLLDDKVGAGTLWSLQVRSASLGTANEGVSLAEGFIAEGFAVNGYLGVILAAVSMAFIALLVSRLIQAKGLFPVALGLLLISYPLLFERGILGTVEMTGKALQVATLLWLLDLLLRSAKIRRKRLYTLIAKNDSRNAL